MTTYIYMTSKELVGAADVARLLGMTRGGVIKAATDGRIPLAGRIGKRQTFVFELDEINKLVEDKAASK